MGLFSFGKKAVAAELAGINLVGHFIDADSCWGDVCGLRSYKTDGPIATCEMAFARAALVKSFLKMNQSEGIVDRIDMSADQFILECFKDEDTDATRSFYGESLATAAPKRVAFYAQHTFMTSSLGSALGATLGVPGMPSVEVGQLFDEVVRQAKVLTAKIRIV